jgi:hypothetical protein
MARKLVRPDSEDGAIIDRVLIDREFVGSVQFTLPAVPQEDARNRIQNRFP